VQSEEFASDDGLVQFLESQITAIKQRCGFVLHPVKAISIDIINSTLVKSLPMPVQERIQERVAQINGNIPARRSDAKLRKRETK